MLPSLYKNVGKTEAKNPLDFGYDPSFMYQPRIQKATGGDAETEVFTRKEALQILQDIKDGKRDDIPRIEVTAERENKKLTHNEAMKILQDIKDGKRDDIPRIIVYGERSKKQEGGEIEEQMGDLIMTEEQEEMPMQEEPMPEMLPDEEMEEDYMDFMINESLSQEEEDYLFEKLNEDEMLSVIFDKVIETASEFAGSGPVEGPGSAVSDSIPARLSDGEFVMTSKAANQIGPDNLQGLMEVAEMEADEETRRTMQVGGYVNVEEEEDEEIVRSVQPKERQGSLMPKSLADKKVSESMIALNPRNSLFVS